MADVTSRLRLVVDSTGLDRAGRKLKDLQRGAKETDDAARRLQSAFAGVARILGTGFAVAGLVKIAEEFTTIQNRLRLVTSGASEFKSVLGDLGKISRESQSALETTVTLYSRVAQFAGDAFDSQKQILDFTGAIQNAFLAAGAGAQEASNAVRQLTQGLASGELRGEEFRSIAEQAPLLAKAIADAVGDGSKSAFELAKEGAFTTEVVIDAVLGKLKEFQEQAALVSPTIGRSLQVLKDQFTLAFGQDLSNVSSQFAGVILDFASNLQTLRPLIEGVAAALGTLATSFALIATFSALPAIIAAVTNPIALLAIAIGGLVAFRDDIAQWAFGVKDAATLISNAFTAMEGPFNATVEVLRGGFAVVLDLAREVAGAIQAINDRFNSLISSGQNKKREGDGSGFFSGVAEIARRTSPFPDLIPNIIGDLRDRGREEINNDIDLDKSINAFLELNKNARDYSASVKAAVASTEDLGIVTKEAAKDAAEIKGIFADLEAERAALLAGSEREGDIIRVTAELLARQSEYYKAMGSDADSVAKADAERIVDLRAGNKALEARNKLEKDYADQRELVDAAVLGEREERIAREILEIRREIAGISVDEARNLAEQNVELEIQLDLIHEQRRIMEEPFTNLASNLTDAILNGGRAGVGGLKKIFGSFLNDLKRAFLYQVFNPLIQSLTSSLGGLFGVNIFTPGIAGGNPANAAVSGSLLAAAGSKGGALGGFGGLGGLPQTALGFGGLALGGGSSIFGLASLLGPGSLGKLGATLGNFLGLSGGITENLSSALAGAGTLGGALGGIGGSLLSGALFGRSTGQSIGSTVGGIAGNLIPVPVLGPLIGSLLGGALGSLFGGKPSNKFARGIFDPNTGAVSGISQKDNSEQANANAQARDDFFASLTAVLGTVAQATGATFAQKLAIEINNRAGIVVGTGGYTPKGGPANAQSFQDPEDALNFAIQTAIASLQGGNDALVTLAKSLSSARVPAEELVNVLGVIGEITESTRAPISKYGEAIKQLDAALDAAAASAQNSAAAEAALAQARADAIGVLRGQFETDISDAIERIKDPALAGFRELSRELATILNDATALGVDIGPQSDVMELIGLQIEAFFEQAASGGADIVELTGRLSELGSILEDLGIDATVAASALQSAMASQRDSFNQLVQNDIGNFLNGPLDQLEKLLEAQKKRLEQAEALGADLTQVERLTALELRQFFQGLSENALNEVRDFLGLFEEAADSVARNLDLSRQDLQGKADQFGQFAQEFSSLATDFRERFVAASPRESIDILRGRANDLLGQIGEGNESAAQALPQVLNQLVESARQSFGNTGAFQDVLDFALTALGQAEQASLGVQTEAERQIAALDESNDLLSDIRDILQSSQAFNALLSSANSGGVASSAELLALIQGGAGLTPNPSNDNAAALSVTGLIAQSMTPVITPLVNSIDNFTQSMAQMPYLQRLQIEATDRSTAEIVMAVGDVSDRLDRIEVIQKQALAELQAA